jgi:hypothetical protein
MKGIRGAIITVERTCLTPQGPSLPIPRGMALDIAFGEERNAVFLTENRFRFDAVDMSKNGRDFLDRE